MSLVRFAYGENPIDDLKKKIRYTYDLHQLLKQELFLAFFHSTNFYEMLLKVFKILYSAVLIDTVGYNPV